MIGDDAFRPGGTPVPAGTGGPEVPAEAIGRAKPVGLWRDTLRNILRQRSAVVGLILFGILIFMAVFATQLQTFNPDKSMLDYNEIGAVKRAGPCIHLLGCPANLPQHLMGLDGNLRDEWSRLLVGSRISLQVGFVTVGLAIVIGAFIGAVAGYASGWLDNVLMRLMDVLLAFPALLLAIAITTVLGASLTNAQLAIAIVAIPVYARVMRASVLAIRESDYVTASRSLGESRAGILFRRIIPNGLTPLIVQGTLGIGTAILDVAALSFLGLGSQPPQADWGTMIASERTQLFTAPHLILFPGIAIVLTVMAFNLLGDGLRDALDPRLNR